MKRRPKRAANAPRSRRGATPSSPQRGAKSSPRRGAARPRPARTAFPAATPASEILVVGSVALDSVRTPFGEAVEALGGSA
ncbi:MAG TPA: hypothetical protein VL123_04235, partial [Candidatus Udaeobacter sp.]|nr:hypothetical protein [Candidatus Udaeobacter sp.]